MTQITVDSRVLECAAMWLGKMIADGGHTNACAPKHCEKTLAEIEKILSENDCYAK